MLKIMAAGSSWAEVKDNKGHLSCHLISQFKCSILCKSLFIYQNQIKTKTQLIMRTWKKNGLINFFKIKILKSYLIICAPILHVLIWALHGQFITPSNPIFIAEDLIFFKVFKEHEWFYISTFFYIDWI